MSLSAVAGGSTPHLVRRETDTVTIVVDPQGSGYNAVVGGVPGTILPWAARPTFSTLSREEVVMSKRTFPRTILSIVALAAVLAVLEPGRHLSAAELYPSVQARSDAEQKIAAALDQPVKNFEFLDTPP
jgi:hypothetical protein